MDVLDRMVLVPADRLDDLLEIVRALVVRLPAEDPTVSAARGVAAEIRAHAVLEP